jgi:hypothetical protein
VSVRKHYETLFRDLEGAHGRLDRETLTAIVGFNAGGPVSMRQLEKKRIYVTCELSLYPEQKESAEGLKFELLSLGAFDEDTCRILFTAIGDISLNEMLGDNHTIDVTAILESPATSVVRLKLFSDCEIGERRFGVYQVVPEVHEGH